MATNTPALFYRGNPSQGLTNSVRYVSTAALTSNLVTLTTSAVHGITQVGTIVNISGVSSVYDGIYAIHSVPSTTQITYVKTNANITSGAVSPNGVVIFNTSTVTGVGISNKAATNGLATLTTSSAHGLLVGDLVTITIGDSAIDGTYFISAVPSTTTFTVPITSTGAISSAAVSQGAVGKHGALYTVPGATSIVITNAVVNNPTASAQTFTLGFDGTPLAYSAAIAANTTAFIDLKQFLATGRTITGTGSSQYIDFQISGITVT